MPTNSPWCRAGLGYVVNSMMLVFQVIGRLGSNSVSTSLRERRSSAIFPKRCNAGGQAGSSWRGLGASSAGRLVCREAVAKRPCPWVTQPGPQPQPQP